MHLIQVSSLLLLAHIPQALSAATSGSFTILTYNIAGLPEPLSGSSPSTNTPLISSRLAPYDVIQVQEDWNYHNKLYASDNHPYRTTTSGIAPFGSGLNTLSNFPISEIDRVKWEDCNFNDFDCAAPKGFTFMRLKVSEGAWLDLYNLHADAGSIVDDIRVRSKNFAQLTKYIQKTSAGMPMVITGDFNCLYPRDTETLTTFIQANTLVDSWVLNARNGTIPTSDGECPLPFSTGTSQEAKNTCEVLDKFMSRSSLILDIHPTLYNNEDAKFLDPQGQPLSDHFPQLSTYSWQLSNTIRLGDTFGGESGDVFNNIAIVLQGKPVPRLTSLAIHSGAKGFSYTVVYPDGSTRQVSHGSTPDSTPVTLNVGERIVQVVACQFTPFLASTRIGYLGLTTNQGRTLQGGSLTDECSTMRIPTDGQDWGLVATWGRAANELRRFGPIWGVPL